MGPTTESLKRAMPRACPFLPPPPNPHQMTSQAAGMTSQRNFIKQGSMRGRKTLERGGTGRAGLGSPHPLTGGAEGEGRLLVQAPPPPPPHCPAPPPPQGQHKMEDGAMLDLVVGHRLLVVPFLKKKGGGGW